jgi:flagellar motor switch protein FliM
VAESVTKLVLTVVFSAMLRLPVEVISEGVSSLTSDANSHTFDKTFTFNITDVNDETPSDITSTGNLNIAENTTVNTNLEAYLR